MKKNYPILSFFILLAFLLPAPGKSAANQTSLQLIEKLSGELLSIIEEENDEDSNESEETFNKKKLKQY